jgi:PAS domain-containing protein
MHKVDDLGKMMTLSLNLTGYNVIEYDILNDLFINKYGADILPPQGCTMQEFLDRVDPEGQQKLLQRLEKLKKGEIHESNQDFLMKPFNVDQETASWKFMHSFTMMEYDWRRRPRHLVCNIKDMTAEHMKEVKDREMASRFARIFDSALVAMSFYDTEGHLIDLNRKMRELCEIDEADSGRFLSTNLFDFPLLKGDFDPHGVDFMHVCQHLSYPEVGIDKYIECRIGPYYENDTLQYYMMTAYDVTEDRKMYQELTSVEKELGDANAQLMLHEKELSYLLSASKMWTWRSSLEKKSISFSRSLRHEDYVLSFDEYRKMIFEDNLERAMAEYGNMMGVDKNFNVTLHFKNIPGCDEPIWAAVSGIPSYDSDGKLTGHFGIVRDVTMLMEAQENLRRETARAEDSGKLKSVFLANMTHEIRTPLNAIVGFSDLLPMIDDSGERAEFMRIIRNNCDMLIRLIDDIIEASNMNRGPLSIQTEKVDFAVAFDEICQTLSQRVQEPGVQFLVDNPYQSFVTMLDKGRLQQVITNFVTNAVKYTHQGHIKVGYRYQDEGIYMYCEDTGSGIPKEKQSTVFDRFVKLNDFVQGTGLGLSICKSIADRCQGKIGVDSEGEGHGSTFWIWIPCKPEQN